MKGKIIFHRFFWFIALVICVILVIVGVNSKGDDFTKIAVLMYGGVFGGIIAFAFFIASLLLSCKTYYYGRKTIIVYSGWMHHYLKIDGVIVDEHTTLATFTPIFLDYTTKDGIQFIAEFSTTGQSKLKANGQLLQKDVYYEVK